MSDVRSLHPSSEDLAQLHEETLSDAVRSKLLAHIADCAECAEAVKVSLALESDVAGIFRSNGSSSGPGPRRAAFA